MLSCISDTLYSLEVFLQFSHSFGGATRNWKRGEEKKGEEDHELRAEDIAEFGVDDKKACGLSEAIHEMDSYLYPYKLRDRKLQPNPDCQIHAGHW